MVNKDICQYRKYLMPQFQFGVPIFSLFSFIQCYLQGHTGPPTGAQGKFQCAPQNPLEHGYSLQTKILPVFYNKHAYKNPRTRQPNKMGHTP